MKKIVQKFGGTSLDTSEKREIVANHIKKAIDSGFRPVVVVSAMGRAGNAYATDTLLKLADKIYSDINPREKDLLMSCGEIISAVIMVQTLQKIGIDAVALTGAQAGILTDDKFGESEVKKVDPANINKFLEEGSVPVVAGFQGVTEDGDITTLGRGGSDTTASILAVAIKAIYIEIYTDVEGIMTADPCLVKDARILSEVSYNEVCELAYQGARVLHPRAAEVAMKEAIPIKVKSTICGGTGTLIHNQDLRSSGIDRPVTGITSRHNIFFINIDSAQREGQLSHFLIFNILAANGISVDFINIRPEAVSFIIDLKYKNELIELFTKHEINYIIKEDLIKLSIVGGGMTGRPGVMAKMIEALSNKNIDVYQTTDSHTTISSLIKRDKEKDALNALHEIFNLGDY